MQTIDVKCNGKSARENRGLSIVRFSLGLHFTQIASCLPVSLIWLYLAIKKSLIWLVNPQKPIFAKRFLLFQILMLENPSLKNIFFLLHMLMLENTLFRVFLFQILEFWLNHHDQALLVRLNKSWESSICERKSAFRFKRRPNHLFKPQ